MAEIPNKVNVRILANDCDIQLVIYMKYSLKYW